MPRIGWRFRLRQYPRTFLTPKTRDVQMVAQLAGIVFSAAHA
jgi:hypothetical protein